MGGIPEHRRILVASAFSLALIVGAYALARGVTAPPVAQASEETQLLQAIATKDSDNDGLPDWEEALYGTDPNNPDTKHLGMTDGQAVAKGLIVPQAIANVPAAASTGAIVNPDLPPAPAEGTLTATFSQNLFTLYLDRLKQSGGTLTDADLADITNQALAGLAGSVTPAPDFKSAKDLTVVGSGTAAMTSYAAAAEAVLEAGGDTATKSELFYLQDAVGGDAAAVDHIRSIAKAYRMGAAGIAALPVPAELAATDLALVNALARMSEVTNDLALVNDDPLAAMLALDEYPAAVNTLADAFIGVRNTYQAAGITLPAGAAGAAFVSVTDDVAASQAASSTTP